jgi:hypothetical protein
MTGRGGSPRRGAPSIATCSQPTRWCSVQVGPTAGLSFDAADCRRSPKPLSVSKLQVADRAQAIVRARQAGLGTD